MFLEEDVYLEHFGKKGMRWGVRNKSVSTNNSSSKPKMSTKKKITIGVGVGAVAIGAAFVAKHIGNNNRSDIVRISKKGKAWLDKVKNQHNMKLFDAKISTLQKQRDAAKERIYSEYKKRDRFSDFNINKLQKQRDAAKDAVYAKYYQ